MNDLHFQQVFRKPHPKGEPFCPIDFYPRRKSLMPLVQFFNCQGHPCSFADHYMISLPPGFPAPLGYVFLGIVPILDEYPEIPGLADMGIDERSCG